jgi:hypothetical protein
VIDASLVITGESGSGGVCGEDGAGVNGTEWRMIQLEMASVDESIHSNINCSMDMDMDKSVDKSADMDMDDSAEGAAFHSSPAQDIGSGSTCDGQPFFSISNLPSFLQKGEPAAQVSALYSQFFADGDMDDADTDTRALSLGMLCDALPSFGKERVGLLLDVLVDRALLRPFECEGELYWKLRMGKA